MTSPQPHPTPERVAAAVEVIAAAASSRWESTPNRYAYVHAEIRRAAHAVADSVLALVDLPARDARIRAEAVAGYEQYSTALANELGEVRTELEFVRAEAKSSYDAILREINDAIGPAHSPIYQAGLTLAARIVRKHAGKGFQSNVAAPAGSVEGSGHPHPTTCTSRQPWICTKDDCPGCFNQHCWVQDERTCRNGCDVAPRTRPVSTADTDGGSDV